MSLSFLAGHGKKERTWNRLRKCNMDDAFQEPCWRLQKLASISDHFNFKKEEEREESDSEGSQEGHREGERIFGSKGRGPQAYTLAVLQGNGRCSEGKTQVVHWVGGILGSGVPTLTVATVPEFQTRHRNRDLPDFKGSQRFEPKAWWTDLLLCLWHHINLVAMEGEGNTIMRLR